MYRIDVDPSWSIAPAEENKMKRHVPPIAAFLSVMAMTVCMSGVEGAGFSNMYDLQLSVSAGRGDLNGVKSALANGASIDAPDALGVTALWHAADMGQTAVANYLLSLGADVNGGAPGGPAGTPFEAAVISKHYDISETMLTQGHMPVDAHAKAVDLSTGTVLSLVVESGDIDLLTLFLSHAHGIDPGDKEPVTGWIAFDHALMNKRNDMAMLLLKSLDGWRCDSGNLQGDLDYAVQDGTPEVLSLLLNKCAVIPLTTIAGPHVNLLDELRMRGDKKMVEVLATYVRAHYPDSLEK
jgi:uncharacterized protein